MRYAVIFEFTILDPEISDGKWHKDYLNNDEKGFTFEEAESVAGDLRISSVSYNRNVEVVELGKEK